MHDIFGKTASQHHEIELRIGISDTVHPTSASSIQGRSHSGVLCLRLARGRPAISSMEQPEYLYPLELGLFGSPFAGMVEASKPVSPSLKLLIFPSEVDISFLPVVTGGYVTFPFSSTDTPSRFRASTSSQ